MPGKTLLDLPPEVLIRIPAHLDNLHSYLAFAQTCSKIRNAVVDLPPPDLLLLTYRTSSFSSRPLHLLTLLGPGIAAYAASSEQRRVACKQAIWRGASGFLEWAVSIPFIATGASLTLSTLRISKVDEDNLSEPSTRIATGPNFSISTLRQMKLDEDDLWPSLIDLIDRNVGKQWYDIEDFWDGARSDAYTIIADCPEVPYQLALWGNMFGKGFEEWLESAYAASQARKESSDPKSRANQWDPNYPPPSSCCTPGIRTDFLKYTYLGWVVSRGIRSPPRPKKGTVPAQDADGNPTSGGYYREEQSVFPASPTDFFMASQRPTRHHPLREVQASIGPYAEYADEDRWEDDHKTLICLISGSKLWGRVLEHVRVRCGGDFNVPGYRQMEEGEQWKQDLWENCVYMLGTEGMRMIKDTWEAVREDEDDRERARQLVMKMDEDERPPEWRAPREAKAPKGLVESGEGWNRLRRWRKMIEGLDVQPKKVVLGNERVAPLRKAESYEFPYLVGDLDLIQA